MSNRGFIQLHRKIQDHWLYQEKRTFSKFEAWVDMIMSANHKDNKFLLGNELVEVKRGQFITSIRKLENRWSWSNTKVINFLNLLEQDEMIAYKSDTKKTVITIDNYGFYHNKESDETTEERHNNDTEATRKHTNNNVKNAKNEKKEQIRDLFDHYLSKDIIQHKKLTGPMERAINARLKDYSVEELKAAIDNYAVVYFSDNYWFTHKYPLADFMRDKDVRRFLDEADPLNNFRRNKGVAKERKVVDF